MNPIDFFRGIQNPKQFVMNMLGQNSNPMIGQLVQMVKKGNTQEIETFARNVLKEKGRNFDTEFSDFMNKIKR